MAASFSNRRYILWTSNVSLVIFDITADFGPWSLCLTVLKCVMTNVFLQKTICLVFCFSHLQNRLPQFKRICGLQPNMIQPGHKHPFLTNSEPRFPFFPYTAVQSLLVPAIRVAYHMLCLEKWRYADLHIYVHICTYILHIAYIAYMLYSRHLSHRFMHLEMGRNGGGCIRWKNTVEVTLAAGKHWFVCVAERLYTYLHCCWQKNFRACFWHDTNSFSLTQDS